MMKSLDLALDSMADHPSSATDEMGLHDLLEASTKSCTPKVDSLKVQMLEYLHAAPPIFYRWVGS